jgi:hypothetical protein
MATFADRLIARPPTFVALRAQIVESQKFQIAPDLLALIRDLPAQAIQDGAQFCRLPFPTTWFEFTTPSSPPDGKVYVGAICRQVLGSEGRRFEMFAFSGTEKGRVPAGDGYAINHQHVPPKWRDDVGSNPYRLTVDMVDPGVIHMDLAPSPHMEPHHIEAFEQTPASGLKVTQTSLMGVAHVVVGALMFMAAKDGARAEFIQHDAKLQRSRAKAGKLPLVSFHRLRIDLPAHERERPAGQGHGDRTPMRGHSVRGHFVHASGNRLWWRRPHIRGDLSRGFVVKRYDLHGSPPA